MPLYVFRCVKCKNEFEQMKKLADKNPKCNNCKSETEIAIKHQPVIRFKGAGFHRNDYDAIGPHEY